MGISIGDKIKIVEIEQSGDGVITYIIQTDVRKCRLFIEPSHRTWTWDDFEVKHMHDISSEEVVAMSKRNIKQLFWWNVGTNQWEPLKKPVKYPCLMKSNNLVVLATGKGFNNDDFKGYVVVADEMWKMVGVECTSWYIDQFTPIDKI